MALADLYTGRWQEPAVEEDVLVRPAWTRDALCIEFPEVEFFPERGESTAPAKEVCARCTVRDECLEFGLHEHSGVWGGTSERQRREIRRKRESRRHWSVFDEMTEQRIARLYSDGFTIRALAARFYVARNTVRDALLRQGVVLRSNQSGQISAG